MLGMIHMLHGYHVGGVCESVHSAASRSSGMEPFNFIIIFLRVPNQNGISLLYIMLEIHHSGREPSNYCPCGCVSAHKQFATQIMKYILLLY